MFRVVIEDLVSQENGSIGETILSIDHKPLEFKNNIEILKDFAPFNLSKKNFINNIINFLEQEAINSDNYDATNQTIATFESWINNLSIDIPFEIEYSKLDVNNLLKNIGIKLIQGKTTIDTIYDYIDFMFNTSKVKLFILINIRNYFVDNDIENLTTSLLSHNINFITIDSYERCTLTKEHRIIIDQDYCII